MTRTPSVIPAASPTRCSVHFQRNGCPGDHNLGVVAQWACTWRPYPRASPGRLTALHSGCAGDLQLAGATDAPGTIDVWYPGGAGARPHVAGAGLSKVRTVKVPGGFRITGRVQGSYTLTAS